MTYEEACEVLDAAREGHPVGASRIRLALWVTGDLRTHEELRGPRVDSEVQEEDWRARTRSRAIMVGRSLQ